jgi:hypothetical protein
MSNRLFATVPPMPLSPCAQKADELARAIAMQQAEERQRKAQKLEDEAVALAHTPLGINIGAPNWTRVETRAGTLRAVVREAYQRGAKDARDAGTKKPR